MKLIKEIKFEKLENYNRIKMELKYKEDYEEVQCIGRGNFGK